MYLMVNYQIVQAGKRRLGQNVMVVATDVQEVRLFHAAYVVVQVL